MNTLRRIWVLCFAASLGFGAAVFASPDVHAQDWSASEDRKAEIASRYKTLVERNPVEGLAFNKLLDYVGRGKGLDRLIKEYEAKVENNSDAVNFHIILGHLYKARSDYNDAIVVYDRAVELAPDEPLPWMSRGLVHLALQKNEEAEADFKKALELESDRAKKQDILRRLADIAFSNRDWEEAQNYYDQLVELDPRNESLRMEYAQVLIQYKRYDKAVEQYDALIRLAGRDAKTRATTMRDKADLYEKMGKDEEALELYRDAMKLVRSDNWLHRELRQRIVEVYRRADRLGELVEEYEGRWRSPNFDQSMELASLYDELGREEEALKYFQRAVRLNRRSTDARLRVIRIMERRGEDKAVVRAYKDLIRVAPREQRYQFDLVRIYFRMGERKQAENLLSQIERRFRRDADVQAALADTYMRFGMQEDALRIYKALLRLEPKNDAYILGLGEYYFQSGELDDAIKTWMKLLDSSLEEGEAHARLGQVLAEHGMVDRGLTHFEKAVEISPDDIASRRGLAMAYERARRWNEAVETWTLILEMSDQPLIANEARGRIINVYRRQNRLRSKMREFQEAFEADPPALNEGFFLAESHLKLSNFDMAEEVYKELVDLGRREASEDSRVELEALLALEKLYQLTRSWEEAVGVLQRLAELRPDQARDYYHRIAELSIRLYEDDQAVHFATLAVQANPDDAMAYARLGDIYEQMQNHEAASVQYRTAVDLDPRAFDIQVKLADLLMELGQTEEAESLYREIAKKANDETLIERAAMRAVDIAQVDGRLEEVEADFFGLVYRTPPKEVYRKVMLEIYERATSPLIQRHRYGVSSDDSIDEELRAIGQRALPVLVDAVHGKNVGQRALAVRLIGDLRQGNGALAVARLVDDPDEPLRLVAAMTAAQIGDSRAAGPLVRASRDSEPTVREIAIWALGGVGGDAAVDRLVEVLTEGQSWREQALAAIALGRVGGKKPTRALVDYYGQLGANRYADYIAVALVWALGRTGDSSTVQVLGDALEKGSARVATVAAWSLASVGGQDALMKLLEVNWTGSKIARRRAERGLALLGPLASRESRARDLLRLAEIRREARLIDERQRSVDVEGMLDRLEQASGLARQDTGKADAMLEMYVAGIVESARSAIDEGFSSRVFADLTDELGELSLGPIRASNAEGRQALTRIATSLAEDARAVVDADASVEAIALIAALGLEDDRARLNRWANHEDPSVRIMAVRGLSGFESEDVLNVLVKALKDPRFDIRVEAARALGTVFAASKTPAVASALTTKLDDEFDSVGSTAAWALGQVGHADSVEPLTQALSTSRVPVKISILEALRDIGTPEAKRVLDRYSRHVDPRIRKAAGR